VRVRGGTALVGSADVLVEVERPGESAGLAKGARVLKIVSRFMGAPDEIAVELTDEGGWRSLGTVKGAQRRTRRDEAIAWLAAEPATFEPLLESADGPSRNTVRRRLDELVRDGLAETLGAGVKGDARRWRLTENGRLYSCQGQNEAGTNPPDLAQPSGITRPTEEGGIGPVERGTSPDEALECPRHEGEHRVVKRAAGGIYLACGCRLQEPAA
jgi:hypothetical protein